MKDVSPLALKTLEEIRDRGIRVLMSFRVPHPEYEDTGEAVPMDQYQAFRRECFVERTVTDYHQSGFATHHIVRDVCYGTFILREYLGTHGDIEIMVDATGKLLDVGIAQDMRCYRERGDFVSKTVSETEPFIRYVSVQTEYLEPYPLTHRVIASDYVTSEGIRPPHLEEDDDANYYEEFVGLWHRYALKPEALAWLG